MRMFVEEKMLPVINHSSKIAGLPGSLFSQALVFYENQGSAVHFA